MRRLLAVALMSIAIDLSAEQLTMTTWYPAPVGVYQSLITTGGTPASPVNTILNRDAGDLGVGTNSPDAKLTVSGDSHFAGKAGIGKVPASGDESLTLAGNTAMQFDSPPGTTYGFVGSSNRVVSSGDPGDMAVVGWRGNLQLATFDGTASRPRLTVTNAGNVGIGTLSPQHRLEVPGDVMIGVPAYGLAKNVYLDYSGIGIGAPAGDAGFTQFKITAPDGNVVFKLSGGWGGETYNYSTQTAPMRIAAYGPSGRSINAAGTVNTNGADYAEWIPWAGDKPKPGTIIQYKGSYLIVSSPHTAAFTGNDRFKEDAAILVSFVGQVPVQVRGPVREGDYIVPNADGTGRAIDRNKIGFGDYKSAVGTAWESNPSDGLKSVNVAVGIR